jgi:hypothetical protein
MEELLSPTKKEGGKHAGTITGQRKKTLAIALGATANVFCQRTTDTQKTTYFRMYYLSQPIAGFNH